jgi:hypothetical protein
MPRRPSPALVTTLAAGLAAVAVAALQACADDRPAGTATVTEPPAAKAPAVKAPGAPGEPYRWVGEVHNRGLDVVTARVRATNAADRATSKARCTLVGRLTAEYLSSERTRDPNLVALGASQIGDAQLAQLAQDAACGGTPRERFGDAVAQRGHRPLDQRLDLSVDGTLSQPAINVLNQVDDAIWQMQSAAGLDVALVGSEYAAAALPDAYERLLVLEAIAVTRASAYYHEQRCQAFGACTIDRPAGSRGRAAAPARPAGSAASERRTGIIHDTVRADAWSCVLGGLRAIAGGPPGIAAGCLWGGLAGSATAIVYHEF